MNTKELYDLLHDRFYYKEGNLHFKPRVNKSGKPNAYNDRIAGSIGAEGYWYVSLPEGVKMRRARAVFLMCHGYLPETVDHDNRIRHDDRIENLLESNPTDQANNRGVRADSASQHKNIKQVGPNCWRVQIRRKSGGLDKCYPTLEEAIKARDGFKFGFSKNRL